MDLKEDSGDLLDSNQQTYTSKGTLSNPPAYFTSEALVFPLKLKSHIFKNIRLTQQSLLYWEKGFNVPSLVFVPIHTTN